MDQRELRGLRTYALYCIVAAALLAVVFLFYFSRTKQNIQEQAEAQLTEVTRQYANATKRTARQYPNRRGAGPCLRGTRTRQTLKRSSL